MPPPQIKLVLFDLDGTLLDTAADMGNALNLVLEKNSCRPMPLEKIRNYVSKGGMALIKLGFGIDRESENEDQRARAEALCDEMLGEYAKNICVHTKLFDGMPKVIATLEARGYKWGVVTNKPTSLTIPLMKNMDLDARAQCIVCGDTLAKRKPAPDQLIYASELTDMPVANAVYIGDDERDIVAGKSARMHTIAAAYGYILSEENPAAWGADAVVNHPREIIKWLNI